MSKTRVRKAKAAPAAEAAQTRSDEIAPTEAELAEAAALKDAVTDPAEVAEARKASEAPPRPAPKTGRWYGVATDVEGESMVTEEPYSTSEAAAQAAPMVLPGDRKPKWVVAVEADSRDEALATYDGLSQAARKRGEPVATVKVDGGAVRVRLTEVRTVPVEAERLLLSPTGILHADPDCRFVRGRRSTEVENPGDAVARVMRSETVSFGEKLVGKGQCLFCAVKTPELVTA